MRNYASSTDNFPQKCLWIKFPAKIRCVKFQSFARPYLRVIKVSSIFIHYTFTFLSNTEYNLSASNNNFDKSVVQILQTKKMSILTIKRAANQAVAGNKFCTLSGLGDHWDSNIRTLVQFKTYYGVSDKSKILRWELNWTISCEMGALEMKRGPCTAFIIEKWEVRLYLNFKEHSESQLLILGIIPKACWIASLDPRDIVLYMIF